MKRRIFHGLRPGCRKPPYFIVARLRARMG